MRIKSTVDKVENGSGPVGNVSDCRLVSLSASSLHGTLLSAGHQRRETELEIPKRFKAATAF